jgi:hypothetical protein
MSDPTVSDLPSAALIHKARVQYEFVVATERSGLSPDAPNVHEAGAIFYDAALLLTDLADALEAAESRASTAEAEVERLREFIATVIAGANPYPFAWVGDVYAQRAAMKAAGDPREKIVHYRYNVWPLTT